MHHFCGKIKKYFHPRRQILAQILSFRKLIEEIKRKILTLTLISVDSQKAFASIQRGQMLEPLRAYRVLRNIIKTVVQLFRDTETQVCSSNGNTNFFIVLARVPQGATIPSFLFIIALDDSMQAATDQHENPWFHSSTT